MQLFGMRRVWAMTMLASVVLSAAGSQAAETKTKGDVEANTIGGIAMVSPESEGFSSARLENLHSLIQGEVDRKELAGAITLLARHGKVVDFRLVGAGNALCPEVNN